MVEDKAAKQVDLVEPFLGSPEGGGGKNLKSKNHGKEKGQTVGGGSLK